jgi:dihydroxy-acid dehydratase
VAMVEEDLRPSRILTRAAFENAIRVCVAIGGSTNAVVHLAAVARRVGVELPLELWDELSRRRRWSPACGPPARTRCRSSSKRAESRP